MNSIPQPPSTPQKVSRQLRKTALLMSPQAMYKDRLVKFNIMSLFIKTYDLRS